MLITKEERKFIAEECTFQHDSPAGYKLIDIEKARKYTMDRIKKDGGSMIKELLPVHPQIYKTPNYGFTLAKDKEFGILYGLYLRDDEHGNPFFQRIRLSDGITINLKNDSDQRIWTVIRMWSRLQGSPFQSTDPIFKLYDPVSEADKELTLMDAMDKALKRAYQIYDSPEDIVGFLRHSGSSIDLSANIKVIRANLLKMARMEPVRFNDLWSDENKPYSQVFQAGVELNVIEHDVGKGYQYGDIHLGLSKDECMLYFKEHDDIFRSIKNRVDNSDTIVKDMAKEVSSNPSVAKESKKEAPKEKTKENKFTL